MQSKNKADDNPRRGWFEERFEELHNRHRYDCLACGRKMYFPKSKVGKYKTCGGECNASLRQKTRDDRSRNCESCGIAFTPRPGQLAVGQGRFCSQKCNTAGRSALNSPESKAKAKLGWMKTFKSVGIKLPRGPDNHLWRGGPEESRRRRLIYVSNYKKSNPDKVKAWASNRRSKGGGKAPGWVVGFLLKEQSYCCVACRADLSQSKYHLDHIVPIALGGGSDVSNLQILCAPCNLSKGAKDPIEFMQEKGFLL